MAWRRDGLGKPVALHHDCNRATPISSGRLRAGSACCIGGRRGPRPCIIKESRDGPLALEPFCQMREPGPSLDVGDVGSIS